MQKIILFIVLAALCLNFRVAAQSSDTNIKPHNKGDTIPETVWKTPLQVINHPKGKSVITLNDYNGKLIILDFWDTYCSNCVEVLPRLDSLQKAFGDSVCILPVTNQSLQSIKLFFAANRYLKGYKIQSITGDKILNKLFPHTMLPHDVWIDKNGRVAATTDPQYIKPVNIRSMINGNLPDWTMKEDMMNYNGDIPLISSGLLMKQTAFYSAVAPFISGIPSSFGVQTDSLKHTIRTYAINFPIVKMYMMALGHLLYYPPNRIILEVKDRGRYLLDKNKSYSANWNRLNSFSYESVLPSTVADVERTEIMLRDLNKYLSLNGRMETRKMHCWVLSLTNPNAVNLFETKGGSRINTLNSKIGIKQIQNAKLSNILWQINEIPGSLPAVDETHFTGNADIILNVKTFSNIKQVQNELARYGLQLRIEYRKTEVFVLSELTP